jgi:hypothetical protein
MTHYFISLRMTHYFISLRMTHYFISLRMTHYFISLRMTLGGEISGLLGWAGFAAAEGAGDAFVFFDGVDAVGGGELYGFDVAVGPVDFC